MNKDLFDKVRKRKPEDGFLPVTQDEAQQILHPFAYMIVSDNHPSVSSDQDSGNKKNPPRESTESM